jgi:hypothetical protein
MGKHNELIPRAPRATTLGQWERKGMVWGTEEFSEHRLEIMSPDGMHTLRVDGPDADTSVDDYVVRLYADGPGLRIACATHSDPEAALELAINLVENHRELGRLEEPSP